MARDLIVEMRSGISSQFAGKQFSNAVDNKYEYIQSAVIAGAASSLNTWKNTSKQDLTSQLWGLLPSSIYIRGAPKVNCPYYASMHVHKRRHMVVC